MKTKLETAYETISSCLNNFEDNYHNYKYGCNASIRRNAERQLGSAIMRAKYLILNDDDLLVFVVGDNATSENIAFTTIETFTIDYFASDMRMILYRLKNAIGNL